MALTFGRSALVLLISLLLAGCFSAEASLLKKTEASSRLGFMKKVTRGDGAEKTTTGDDDDDDDDDEDEDDDKKDEKSEKKVVHLAESNTKEVDHLKHELAENMKEQLELQDKIKHLSDETQSHKEIDAASGLVAKETESPAMANMLGKMWKDMRMFETPFYAEHVEEELHHLKAEQHSFEAKLAAEQTKASISMEESESDEHESKKEQKKASTEAEVKPQGHEDCPCIGINELEGETVATLKNGKQVPYPADLGGECKAWDLKKHPSCPGAAWCEQEWCYVDPCNCKNVAVLPKPSIYLPGAKYQGKPVHFSYATCGGKDTYSSEKEKKKTVKDIEKTCAVEVDSAKFGAENCRCIGISPQPGTTKVSIKDKKVEFPADAGAVCNTWEKDNHPDCDSDDAPEWCNQAWCYVDPCSCKLPTPPKTSAYLPGASYQDKPMYFSYATCGGKDAWTAGNKKACVNAKTAGACSGLDKCAWTGKECLGKELVNTCGLQAKSGSWSARAFLALLLPLVAFVN